MLKDGRFTIEVLAALAFLTYASTTSATIGLPAHEFSFSDQDYRKIVYVAMFSIAIGFVGAWSIFIRTRNNLAWLLVPLFSAILFILIFLYFLMS